MIRVLLVSLVISFSHGGSQRSGRSNVCKTFKDYAHMDGNPRCWYNPDVGSHPSLIAKRYGYPFEKYKVQTEDGYILSLYRIPQNNIDKNKGRQPIILQHGIAITSACWMMIGKRSLAFYLSDLGYDVWLPNIRGTEYSTNHVNYTIDDPIYWNFSFHEMGLYDLPAVIDFVAEKTHQRGNIIFIGHSMGSTMSYVYASLKNDHAKRSLKSIISLAPIANLKNARTVAKLLIPFIDAIENILHSMGLYALGQFPQFQRLITENTCSAFPAVLPCEILTTTVTGLSVEQVAPEVVPVYLSFFPSGTSVKTLVHYGQVFRDHGRFQYYDYGPEQNMKIYNSRQPPIYPLENINVPVHLFAANNDFLSDLWDVKVLYDNLKTGKTLTTLSENGKYQFAHNDYMMGRHMEEFYKALSDILN